MPSKTRSSHKTSPSAKSRTYRTCYSRCYRYKTDNEYLCNRRYPNGYCHIEPTQLSVNMPIGKNMPNKQIFSRYWDSNAVAAKNEKDRFCYDGKNDILEVDESTCQKYSVKWVLSIFGIFIIYELSSQNTALKHIVQKYRESKLTEKEFVEEMYRKYVSILKKHHSSIEIPELKIDFTKNNGDIIKNILKNSIKFIKSNTNTVMKNHTTVLIEFVVKHINSEDVIDVLSGAACVVPDEGYLYDYMNKKHKPYIRFSSHYKNSKIGHEFGFTGFYADSVLHMLIGKYRTTSGDIRTYFQFEGSPNPPGTNETFIGDLIKQSRTHPHDFIVNFKFMVNHGIDFIGHKTTGKNIGSFGVSDILDANAKIININMNKSSSESPPKNKTISVKKVIDTNFTDNSFVETPLINELSLFMDFHELNVKNNHILKTAFGNKRNITHNITHVPTNAITANNRLIGVR